MKKLILTFLTILFCLTSNVTWSADFQKGLAAAERGDFATALRDWTPLAKQGDADAQIFLGGMYAKGRGVPQDYKAAIKWYTFAAEQGDPTGQIYLGILYGQGQGVMKDLVYAYMWLSIAATSKERGSKRALDFAVKHMTPSQIEKAQKLARECVRKKYKGC
jgi:TPR repeat protein